jgi:hypothetical protein
MGMAVILCAQEGLDGVGSTNNLGHLKPTEKMMNARSTPIGRRAKPTEK